MRDDTTPATKGDVQLLRNDMLGKENSLRNDMIGMEKSLRNDMIGMEKSLRNEMKGMENSLRNDMKALEKSFKNDLQNMKNALESKIDGKFKYVNEGIDQVLVVLGNMDKRLSGKDDDHEERIVRIETVVFS